MGSTHHHHHVSKIIHQAETMLSPPCSRYTEDWSRAITRSVEPSTSSASSQAPQKNQKALGYYCFSLVWQKVSPCIAHDSLQKVNNHGAIVSIFEILTKKATYSGNHDISSRVGDKAYLFYYFLPPCCSSLHLYVLLSSILDKLNYVKKRISDFL